MTSSIRWPPPGLERLQGDLVRVATRAALGGGILVAPLLFVLARRMDFATLGPFADAWWVTVVLAIIGLTFAADALVRTMTLLRRVSKALAQGYDLHTLLMVVCDRDRDMGFLLTGGRHFSDMDAKEREAIGRIRLFSTVLYALAGIWLPNALALGILLAARGWVTPTGLWVGTALPSAGLYLFALVAGTAAETRVRRARRRWYGHEWVSDLASEEANAWRQAATPAGAPPRDASQDRALGRTLGYASVIMGTLAALVAIPILTLVPTAAVGPILAELAVPGFDDVRARSARVEALRTYRVQADSTVTPDEAGGLLQEVLYAGSDREASPGEREPPRRVEARWLADGAADNPGGLPPSEWPDSLFTVVARGLPGAQAAYLERLASHPARGDFSRLARAAAIDVASGRYLDPLPPELALVDVPLPRFADLRDAAYSHVGAAAAAFAAGRPAQAEELLEEVVSLGFVLGDGGPTLLDNVIGFALAEQGGQALADLYRASGDTAEATRLAALQAAAAGAASRSRFRYPEGAEAWLRSLPEMVADTSVARGLRWEVFIGITTLTPCVNLQRLVFGPDQAYWDFVDGAHDQLVEWPSEEALFSRARLGWFGSTAGARGTFVGRILSISMRTGEGTCGEVVRQLEAAEALF